MNQSSPYTDFDPANYIWEPKFYDIFANGDGQYLYPCEDGKPCTSIRLSNIRDGLEDWELFAKLRQSNVVENVDGGIQLIEEMVRSARDWEDIGKRKLEIIRLEIAKMILQNN